MKNILMMVMAVAFGGGCVMAEESESMSVDCATTEPNPVPWGSPNPCGATAAPAAAVPSIDLGCGDPSCYSACTQDPGGPGPGSAACWRICCN